MVDADTTVANLRDDRLQEDDNRSQLSQTSDLWETSGVRMSALCLNVLHDISDAASQYSNSERDISTTRKESRKKGFVDFFRFTRRRSKSKKKKKPDTHNADSMQGIEDAATGKEAQLKYSAPIPPRKEEGSFKRKEEEKSRRNKEEAYGNFDISPKKSATLPRNIKEDKQHSDSKKKTKLASDTTKGNKRSTEKGYSLPRTDHAEEKSSRLTGPLKLLETNIQKMVTNVNRKFPPSPYKSRSSGQVKSGIEVVRDKEDQSDRNQSRENSVISKKEETQAGNSDLDVISDDPRSALEKNTAETEQEMYQQFGTEKETPVARRIPNPVSRGRTEVRDYDKLRRGRSAEVRSKKGKRIRRRALSREWVLVKTTRTEETTLISAYLKKSKHYSLPSDEPVLAAQPKNKIESDAENLQTRRDTEGLSGRMGLTEGVPESQSPVQNDMNNNDSTDLLQSGGSVKWAPGIVERLEKRGPNFFHTTSELSPHLPASNNEGSISDVNMLIEMERKVLSEETYEDPQSSIQALLRKQWPEQDKPNPVHTTPQFSPHPTSSITQNHPILPDSHLPAVNMVEEMNMRNLSSDTDTDQLSPVTTQALLRNQCPELDELNSFPTTSQLSTRPTLPITQNHQIVPESNFSTEDMTMRNLHLETDIDQFSLIQALLRRERPDDLENCPEHNIFSHDEKMTSEMDKPRWTKRKPATRSRKELSEFESNDAATEPMSQTIYDSRLPQFFSGNSFETECEPFEGKIMKRNETQNTSRPTKPRWTKRKPATRGRRQSPLRGDGHVQNAPMIEIASHRNEPFFLGDSSALGDLSLLEVTNPNTDRRQLSEQSKPRWTKRKSATRAKRTLQLERDKPTSYHMDRIDNEPFISSNTGGSAENYDFSGVNRIPRFIEEVFVGREPTFDEVNPMLDPVFRNIQGIDEDSFAEFSGNQNEPLPLEGIHLNDQFNRETDKSQIINDTRNTIEPEFFWNAQCNDELFAVTSVGDVQATGTLRAVVSHDRKEPPFSWNSPFNDESSEFEDRNEASFYGDAEVSDEPSVSEVTPDRNERFSWSTKVDDNPSNIAITSDKIESSSLYEQSEVKHDQPCSDVTNGVNDSSFVDCTDASAAADGASVQATESDSITTLVCPAANEETTEISDDITQVMRKLNAPIMSYPYTEKCEDRILKIPSDQHLSAKHAVEAELIECDWAADQNTSPHLDPGYLSRLHNMSQNQPTGKDLCEPDQGNRALPFATISRCEDMSVPLTEDVTALEDENDEHASIQKRMTKSAVQESYEDNVFAEDRQLSASVLDPEALPGGVYPGFVHDMPPEETQSSIHPTEDNNNRTDNNSETKQNDSELKKEPIIDVISSSGSHLGVKYRSRPRPIENGDRVTKGKGCLVDDGRTASPKFKCESGSGSTPSPRDSANDVQLREWLSKRLFSADDDRSSPMPYLPRRLNVDLPYSDSGYSETEAETLSPCSFRSSVSRTDTVTGEEGRCDFLADDDSRFTFQITDDMRSFWFNMGRSVCEKESVDCFPPDHGSQMGIEKVETSGSLENGEDNSIDLAAEHVFNTFKPIEENSLGTDFDNQNTVTERPTLEALKNDKFAAASQRPGKTELLSHSDSKKNSFDSPVSGSEPTAEALKNDEFAPASQRPSKTELLSHSGAKKNSFDSSVSGTEPTAEALKNDEVAPASQRPGKTELLSHSDAKKNSFDSPVSGTEPTAEALKNDEFAPASQRPGKTELMSHSEAKENSYDSPVWGSEPTAEALKNNEFAPASQRSGKTELMSHSDAKENSFGSPVSGSELVPVESELPQLKKETEQSCKAQDRLSPETQLLLDQDEETVDESVANNFRKQGIIDSTAVPTIVRLARSEEKAFNNEKPLTEETRLHAHSISNEEEAVDQNKALPSEALFMPQDSLADSGTTSKDMTPVDEALFRFQRYDDLTVEGVVNEGKALKTFKSPVKIEISRDCAAGGAIKTQTERPIVYPSVMESGEPVKCYIVPTNEKTGAVDEKPIKRANHVSSELPISVVKEDFGTDLELFTWYEYAELHSIFRQFPKENYFDCTAAVMGLTGSPNETADAVDLSLLPSTWIWNGSRFINYYTSLANKENTIHFPDPRPCRSIVCPTQQDTFTLVHGVRPRQQCLSTLERLQLGCSAERQALIQIKALRTAIQENRSPKSEDLGKVKALLSKIQTSHLLGEEALTQVNALLRKVKGSLSRGKEERNALPSELQYRNSPEEEDLSRDEMPEVEIQQSSLPAEEEFTECNALRSELQCRNSPEEEDLVPDEFQEDEIQQNISPVEEKLFQCNAWLSELQCRISSQENELIQDEMQEVEIQQSSLPVEEKIIELPAAIQRGNSSEEELIRHEMLEGEFQKRNLRLPEEFIECNALPRELQCSNSSEEEDLVPDEMPEVEIQQSISPVEEELHECNALPRELQCSNSSEDEELVQDEVMEGKVQQSSSAEEEVLIDDKALPSNGSIRDDSATEGSTSLSKTSADQEFSAAKQSSADDDNVLDSSITESKSSDTPVASSTISEPKGQGSQTGEADISSESQLRLRNRPATENDVNDCVIPKQTKTLSSKRTVVCLLTSTAGLLSALLILYLSVHMKYIDI